MINIITSKYHRDFAIDRGMGIEYVRWMAWRKGYPNVRGYGKTEQEAIDNLKSYCEAS